METQSNPASHELLDKTLQVFKKHFMPADSIEDSSQQMTTQEVLDKFQALMGEESINANNLAVLLMNNGYVYDYIVDEFLWLFKIAK